MTKTAQEYPQEAMAFHASWRSAAPATAFEAHEDEAASSAFLADLAERIAAVCIDSQCAERGVPLLHAAGARDDYCRTQRVPMLDGSDIMIFAADGNMRALEEIEADVIRLAVGHYGGRISEVARRLQIGRSTLYRKLAEYEIEYSRQ